MDSLQNMRVFRQVAELSSFVKASEKFGISTPMISKHVKELEEHLGLRLLHRTSRRVSLTQDGQIYLERISELLDELDDLENTLSSKSLQPRGNLRIAAPIWLFNTYLTECLSTYQQRFPEVILDIQLADRHTDLIEQSIDLALRVTPQPQENLFARKLCSIDFHIVGHSDYLDQFGRPEKAADLSKYKWVINTSVKGRESISGYENGQKVQIDIQPVFQTNSTHLVAQATASKMGLAILPALLLREAPFDQKLEIVLPEFKMPFDISLYAVYTSRKLQSPKVRSFIDHMVAWFHQAKVSSI